MASARLEAPALRHLLAARCRMTIRKYGLLLFSLLASSVVFAQTETRLETLEAALNRVNLEQQAVYQQFQMAQELRRNELQEAASPTAIQSYPMGMDNTRMIDYDENLRLQRQRQERLQRYERDIAAAYARYQELGNQKKILLDQILELSMSPKR